MRYIVTLVYTALATDMEASVFATFTQQQYIVNDAIETFSKCYKLCKMSLSKMTVNACKPRSRANTAKESVILAVFYGTYKGKKGR